MRTASRDTGQFDREWIQIVAELNRRGFLGGAALLGLAGCGSTGKSVSDSAHTVSMQGKFGRVDVPSRPTPVVTLGQGPDTDAALALGITPVAITRDPTASGGIQPWTAKKFGDHKPALLDTTDGPSLERIAALHPHLIVATTYYGLAQYHQQLSLIAPVLSYVTGPNTDRWQDTTTRLGHAFDRQSRASGLIANVQSKIADARRNHPTFSGATFTFGPVQADGTIYTTSSSTDLSAALLAQLGLRLSPKVTALPQSSTAGKSIVSPERLDLLDADVLILSYITTDQQERVEANPLFRRLKAVRTGAYIALPLPVAIAMAFPSVLSIPYALNSIVPMLARSIH